MATIRAGISHDRNLRSRIAALGRPELREKPEEVAARIEPDSESRRSRFKSDRTSAALWERKARSFSRHLLTISSRCGGRSGFKRSGGAGGRLRMASKMTAEVSPRKGTAPVAIS